MSSNTLDPLPTLLRHGLYAVAFCGLLSLTTTTVLFSWLTYRLLTWYRRGQISNGANQFLILIYNLLVADIQQAIAFSLTTTYLIKDKIQVGTTTCSANGWFVSVGDLASGVFIFGIALHTFVAVVKGHTISDRLFYVLLACAWSIIYALAILTVALRRHAYARAGAWCWIDHKYDNARLWLHYLWIFACMFGTIVIYALIYIFINTRLPLTTTDGTQLAATKRAAKHMIIYPVVYVACTLPLAGGRMAAMTGMHIPFWYYCVAGSAITSCGWLDVLLYTLTRRAFIFSKEPPSKDCLGLHTFGWYNGSSFYGTTTTIEGPLSKTKDYSFKGVARDHRSIWLLRKKRKRYPDEQYFASALEGVITTKTTVEVTSGPVPDHIGAESYSLNIEDYGKTPDASPRL